MPTTRATLAKILTLVGGGISTIAVNQGFGRYSAAIGSLGGAMVAIGAALASDTSAGHPNGAATTKAEAAPLVKTPPKAD